MQCVDIRWIDTEDKPQAEPHAEASLNWALAHAPHISIWQSHNKN